MARRAQAIGPEPGDIARISVEQMVQTLGAAYVQLFSEGRKPDSLPAIMLWGQPGSGKSAGVRQLAERLRQELGRQVAITDVRLLLFNPVDLRGIPVADAQKRAAIWLRPHIFEMSPDASMINILFLDELSAAPPSMQAAAYQLVLDRAIGEHRLPENCIVMAAGNREEDSSVVWKMPAPLANRLCHLEAVVMRLSK